MKRQFRAGMLAVGILGAIATCSMAQLPSGKGESTLAHAASQNKTACLVFYREWDPASVSMAEIVKGHAEKYAGNVGWNVVPVSEPAEKSIVDRFQLSRAPMPMVVTVHPNGAVTGFFGNKVSEADLSRTLVSPKKAECMKALQQNQLVLFCIQTQPEPLPPAVVQFQADPMFAARTKIVTVLASDPNEATFLAELRGQSAQTATVLLAPPGVLVGRFAVTASKNDLATALHAAGKCCDDKNCKHNH